MGAPAPLGSRLYGATTIRTSGFRLFAFYAALGSDMFPYVSRWEIFVERRVATAGDPLQRKISGRLEERWQKIPPHEKQHGHAAVYYTGV